MQILWLSQSYNLNAHMKSKHPDILTEHRREDRESNQEPPAVLDSSETVTDSSEPTISQLGGGPVDCLELIDVPDYTEPVMVQTQHENKRVEKSSIDWRELIEFSNSVEPMPPEPIPVIRPEEEESSDNCHSLLDFPVFREAVIELQQSEKKMRMISFIAITQLSRAVPTTIQK